MKSNREYLRDDDLLISHRSKLNKIIKINNQIIYFQKPNEVKHLSN